MGNILSHINIYMYIYIYIYNMENKTSLKPPTSDLSHGKRAGQRAARSPAPLGCLRCLPALAPTRRGDDATWSLALGQDYGRQSLERLQSVIIGAVTPLNHQEVVGSLSQFTK